jgi:hypothetical protein
VIKNADLRCNALGDLTSIFLVKQTQLEYAKFSVHFNIFYLLFTNVGFSIFIVFFFEKIGFFFFQDTIDMTENGGETKMSELFQRRYAYPLIVSILN